MDQAALKIHVYQPTESDEFEEFTSGKSDGEDVMAATVCELPCRAWEGLWERYVASQSVNISSVQFLIRPSL